MGKLVTLSEFKVHDIRTSYINPTWYFEDARIGYGTDNYTFEWPNKSYPCSVAIHDDDMQNSIKIEIRRWIETNLQETVICNYIDKSYRYYYNNNKEWDESYKVDNLWIVFYFEDKHSATMFSLRFSTLVKEITDKHPTKEH